MTYKDLLVHLDDGPTCARRVAAAIELAERHGAHLTGLYVTVEIPLLSYIRAQIPPDLRAQMAAEEQAKAEAGQARFRDAAERAGIAYEARTDQALDTTLSEVVAMHARYADLLVLGQVDPDQPPQVGRHLPEEVVLAAGRPVLVVPCGQAPTRLVGSRVVIAWDGSREAARAVGDAMPILERAAAVLAVTIDPRPRPPGEGELAGRDIALHLARHGVEVEARSVPVDDPGVAEALLSLATAGDHDLVVMGAYAHSRLRELILGGVTRTILERMTLPVLMAH